MRLRALPSVTQKSGHKADHSFDELAEEWNVPPVAETTGQWARVDSSYAVQDT